MPDLSPLPVTTGFTWTSAGAWGAFLTLLGMAVKQAVPWRKVKLEADTLLIETLSKRVDKLEKDLSDQRLYYEARIDKLVATHEAAQRVSRHELGNVKMRFRALVMLLKRLPDQSPALMAILADIEAMEAEQAKAEALEKGAQSGERIATAVVAQMDLPTT